MINIDLKRSISLDDIIDRVTSQTVYRNLEKYEGIFLETRFKGVKLYGGRLDCVIDSKICLIENEKNKKLNKKFEIFSDYTSMCVKEWTNIYYRIYDNHPSIYRYKLGEENEKSIYNNFVNRRISTKKDIIYNIDIDREAVLDSWFKSNYHLFRFTNIYKSDIRNIDYICEYGNSYIYIELEYLSSNFIKHGHDPNIVDMVICYRKDTDLSIPVIEIENLRV